MDLPKCKICGERHALGSCPKFDAAEQRREWLKAMSGPPKPVAAPPPKKSKAKFDRNKYQRDYMRKRRGKP